jgi:glycosyltransferase involved in cell wall biosynthesis
VRILFIGEYSRLHNSLKEALVKLGHEVKIVGNGDGFKDYPVDFNIDALWSKSIVLNPLRQIIYRLFKYDFAKIENGIRFYFLLPELKNYDIVQLISETPIQTQLGFEYALLKRLRTLNRKMFMLSSGTDVVFMKAVIEKKFRYSLLDAYLKNPATIEEYRHVLPHLESDYKKHHEKMLALTEGMIATDIDYAIALEGKPEYLGVIPNPVNTDKIAFTPIEISGPIRIFHGINRWNYNKKGNAYFEKALETIQKKYGNKVKISTVENVPYAKYIKLFDAAHIVLDQVNAYDQGYNALEAMAKGKVVFTGAEIEFMKHYGLTSRVAVNALPSADAIAAELSALIDYPNEIIAIGKRAREFVEHAHDYLKVAEKYLEIWKR